MNHLIGKYMTTSGGGGAGSSGEEEEEGEEINKRPSVQGLQGKGLVKGRLNGFCGDYNNNSLNTAATEDETPLPMPDLKSFVSDSLKDSSHKRRFKERQQALSGSLNEMPPSVAAALDNSNSNSYSNKWKDMAENDKQKEEIPTATQPPELKTFSSNSLQGKNIVRERLQGLGLSKSTTSAPSTSSSIPKPGIVGRNVSDSLNSSNHKRQFKEKLKGAQEMSLLGGVSSSNTSSATGNNKKNMSRSRCREILSSMEDQFVRKRQEEILEHLRKRNIKSAGAALSLGDEFIRQRIEEILQHLKQNSTTTAETQFLLTQQDEIVEELVTTEEQQAKPRNNGPGEGTTSAAVAAAFVNSSPNLMYSHSVAANEFAGQPPRYLSKSTTVLPPNPSQLFAGHNPTTTSSWNKQGQGPAVGKVKMGNNNNRHGGNDDKKKPDNFVPGTLQMHHGNFLEKEGSARDPAEEFIPGQLQLHHGNFLEKDGNGKDEDFCPNKLQMHHTTADHQGREDEEFVPGSLQLCHGNFLDKDGQEHKDGILPGQLEYDRVAAYCNEKEEFLPSRAKNPSSNKTDDATDDDDDDDDDNLEESQASIALQDATTTDQAQEASCSRSGSINLIGNYDNGDDKSESSSSSSSSVSSSYSSDDDDDDLLGDSTKSETMGNKNEAVFEEDNFYKAVMNIRTKSLSEEDKKYKAACCIQRFFQYTREVYEYHREEIEYWQQEKADVMKRHQEELALIRQQLQMEKDQSEIEIQKEMERREQLRQRRKSVAVAQKLGLPITIDWTFSDTSFAWVQDHDLMQEIQQEKQTQEKLKEWIRVCTNWNRQLAVDKSKWQRKTQDAKALLKKMKKIASVEKKVSKEKSSRARIEKCIAKVTKLVESRIGGEDDGAPTIEIVGEIQCLGQGVKQKHGSSQEKSKTTNTARFRGVPSRKKKSPNKRRSRDHRGRRQTKLGGTEAMHESAFLLDLIGFDSSSPNLNASSVF